LGGNRFNRADTIARKGRLRVQDKTVLVKGRRFHYRDWGSDSSPVLVLLHGLEGLSVEWDGLAHALEDRCHVLALDQIGHGGSDWLVEIASAGHEVHVHNPTALISEVRRFLLKDSR
jgi:alpha-beta hydrolase superfamily lysophospholipase